MKIHIVERLAYFRELESRLRGVRLLGSDVRPYADADIGLRAVAADFLHPVQTYVSRRRIDELTRLRAAIWETCREDMLRLFEIIRFRVEGEDGIRAVAPPIVVWSREQVVPFCPQDDHVLLPSPPITLDLPIIADGMHRCWMARESGVEPVVLTVSGVKPETPYYAYPSSWTAVEVLPTVPEEKHKRKRHRVKNHYSLYRDYSSLGSTGPRHPGEIAAARP